MRPTQSRRACTPEETDDGQEWAVGKRRGELELWTRGTLNIWTRWTNERLHDRMATLKCRKRECFQSTATFRKKDNIQGPLTNSVCQGVPGGRRCLIRALNVSEHATSQWMGGEALIAGVPTLLLKFKVSMGGSQLRNFRTMGVHSWDFPHQLKLLSLCGLELNPISTQIPLYFNPTQLRCSPTT